MNTKQFEQALTDATNQIAHTDLVQDYRARFYKLSQEAEADGVNVQYMVHDRSTAENNKASNLLGDTVAHQPETTE